MTLDKLIILIGLAFVLTPIIQLITVAIECGIFEPRQKQPVTIKSDEFYIAVEKAYKKD